MVRFKINGPEAPFGTIRTRYHFNLTNFPARDIQFSIMIKGRSQPLKKNVKVDGVITEALNFIDTHCAKSKVCNDYFMGLDKRNPTTLRRILDEKELQIFRLGGMDDKDMPAGFTLGWGPQYAQIGLNSISLTDSGNAAAVLVHELAHVAGAPGRDVDPKSHAAERALLFCGLKKFFDPEAVGVIDRRAGERYV